MALFPPRNPLLRQPSHLARINPRHWLARDLVFVHSGYREFVFGRPGDAAADTLRSNALTGTQNPALVNTRGWVPDGTNYAVFPLGIDNLPVPLTLSVWWFGVAGSTTDGIFGLSRSAGQGGYLLRRDNTERVSLLIHQTDGNTSINAPAATGHYLSGRWQHGVATFPTATSRYVYADGGYEGVPGTSSRTLTNCDQVVIGANLASSPVACSTVISGIALPMLLSRAMSADEVARLHEEQRSNPWNLFTERPIWVPVSAAAQDYVRPQIHISRAAVARASRW